MDFLGIMSAISAAVEIVKTVISVAKPLLEVIGNAILEIAKVLGVVTESTNVEELGEKALQAEEDGIKPKDYKSCEEYIRAIEKYEINPDKKHDPETARTKGTVIATGLALEMCPAVNIEKLIGVYTNSLAMKEPNYLAEISKLAVTNPNAVNAVADYLTKHAKTADVINLAKSTLIEIEKTTTPGISDTDAMLNVIKLLKG